MPETISIVIPAYNEENRLPATLRALTAYAGAHPEIAEVVVVDDGSRDNTAAVVRAYAHTDPRVRLVGYSANGGKGYAIRRGVIETRGDLVLISDADLSTPIDELETLRSALADHEIVIGSRALDESLVTVRQSWYRQTMGKTFNRIMRAITGVPFLDTQCGFKLLTRDAARTVFTESTVDRFAYDVEMLILASRHGFRVAEVPVRWVNSPDSRVSIVRDASRMLFDLLAVRGRLGRYRTRPAPGHDPRDQKR